MKKLDIAIIGQGRSGRDIHGAFYRSEGNEFVTVKYVVDEDAYRREVALKEYPGCTVFADYRDLLDKTDIDLVVNASYSRYHYSITKDLLEHNFHVLVEKPFARTQYECQTLIRTAKAHHVVLAVFQQTFFAPYYQEALKVLHSGKIGDVLQASVRFNGFSRRWDWQTLQKMVGGNAYNTGPHPIGIALGLVDFDPEARIAYSRLAHTPLSFGDADDYCKLILDTPGKPTVDVEISNTDAFCDYNIKLQGTKGTFTATTEQYKIKYIVDGENEAHTVSDKFICKPDKTPAYCSEKLNVHEETGSYGGTAFDVGTHDLYQNLYEAITEGKPLYVTPEMACRVIGVIETLHAKDDLPVLFD